MRYGVSGLALAVAIGSASWGVAGVANGQSLPSGPTPPQNVETDANGVDLITGQLNLNDTQVSIGISGSGILSSNYNGSSTVNNFQDGISKSGNTYSVIVNGVSKNFTSATGVHFTSTAGDGATLVPNANTAPTAYTYTAQDGTVANFFVPEYTNILYNVALISSISYPNGEALNFSYAVLSGGSGGRSPTYELASVNSNYGYQIKYTISGSPGYYSTSGVIGINNSVEACNATALTCSLSNSWPTTTFSGSLSVTDPLGRTNTYNGNATLESRTYTIVRPSGLTLTITNDSLARVTSFSNGVGTWNYAYSTSGTTQTTTVTDPNGNQNTYVSNTSLDVITSTKDALGRVTSYAYDSHGRQTSVTHPDGDGIQYAYDTNGNITQRTVTPVPGSGQPNLVTSATFPCASTATCNKPSTTTDANGNVTSYTYDATTGVLLTVNQPAGANGVQPQTRYSYTWLSAIYKNSSGGSVTGTPIYLLTGVSTCATGSAPSCVGTADETRLSISYDTNNNLRPVSTTVSAGDGSLTATTTASYDSVGNLLTTTNPVGAVTSYLYDADRELIGVVSPAAGGTGQYTSAAERITYNPDGRPTLVEQGVVNSASASDWANFSSQVQAATAYDSAGRKIQATLSGGGSIQSLSQYSYDAANRLNCVAVRMSAGYFGSEPGACTLGSQSGDGPDRITQYTYDAANELTQVVTGLGTSAQKTVEKLQYEGDGHVSYIWDGNGNLTTNYWDGLGRLGLVQYPTPNNSGASNANDYVTYSYDNNSNVTSKRLRDGITISMAYDAGNHMTTGGDGSAYSYDNMGRVRTANYGGRNLSFAYDALGRMMSQTSNLGTLSYSYDAAGDRTGMVWPDGFAMTFYYNANSTLQSFWEGSNPSGGYAPMSFYYNGLNQMWGIARSNGVGDGLTYDSVSRLNGVSLNFPDATNGNSTNIGVNYNEASQALNISNSNGLYDWPAPTNFSNIYGVNGLNQITGFGSYTFGYDAKGNLTSDGANSYGYDVLNRLTQGPNGVSLSYDALGRLASTTNNQGVTTQYLYDGQNLVATYDGSGNVTSHYVFGQGTDQPVMWYNGPGTGDRRFLLTNTQGSIIGVSDVNGNLLAANTYDEFGVPGTNNQGAFQYTGQLWLPDAGLYYYKARIYSPTLGRYLQTDPIGYSDGPNWYNYVHGDPVNGIDPSGLDGDFPTVTYTGTDPTTGNIAFQTSEIDTDATQSSGGAIGSGGGGGILALPRFISATSKNLLHLQQNTCYIGLFSKVGDKLQGYGLGIGLAGGLATAIAPEAVVGETAVGAGVALYSAGSALKDSVSITNLILNNGNGSGYLTGQVNDLILNNIAEGPMRNILAAALDKAEDEVGLEKGDGGNCGGG